MVLRTTRLGGNQVESSLFSLFNLLETPVFFVDHRMLIRWHNPSAEQVFTLEDGMDWSLVWNDLPQHYVYRLHECIVENQAGMLVECVPTATPQHLEEMESLRATNRELEAVFNVLDDLFITDGDGVTMRVNKATERLYGVRGEDLIGRSVYDLEKERLFYPSVTALVLRVKHTVTILQRTKDGRQLVVTGYPVVDEQGQIIRVITSANDVTNFHMQQGNMSGSKHINLDREDFITESPAMRLTLESVERVTNRNTSILLLGETGVGKNRLARFIHQMSKRKSGPFIEINCAAIPDSLLESELFGYEGGAFTGARRDGKPGKVELAERGTLFLNEIAELPLALQGKLLDFIQDKQVSRIGGTRSYTADIRIIAATNRNLEERVLQGAFREDLYYRLNVFPIVIPPLRERKQDISHLAESFLSRCPSCQDGPAKFLHPSTLQLLQRYPWPGNIRELENTLERMVITTDEPVLLPEHLPAFILKSLGLQNPTPETGLYPQYEQLQAELMADHRWTEALDATERTPLPSQMASFERRLYEQAIGNCRTTYEIAEYLGVSQPTVVRKLRQFGLSIR